MADFLYSSTHEATSFKAQWLIYVPHAYVWDSREVVVIALIDIHPLIFVKYVAFCVVRTEF
jgi:hypothetical protein